MVITKTAEIISSRTDFGFAPPAVYAVGRGLHRPFGILSAAFLCVSSLLLALTDTLPGTVILLLSVLFLVAVIAVFKTAHGRKSAGALTFLAVSSFVTAAASAACSSAVFFGFIIPQPDIISSVAGLVPEGIVNSENPAAGILFAVIAVASVFTAISACTVKHAIRRNLPKFGLLYIASVVILMSGVVSLLSAAEIFLHIYGISFTGDIGFFTYTESSHAVWISAAAAVFLGISCIFGFISLFKTANGLRKVKNAFCR